MKKNYMLDPLKNIREDSEERQVKERGYRIVLNKLGGLFRKKNPHLEDGELDDLYKKVHGGFNMAKKEETKGQVKGEATSLESLKEQLDRIEHSVDLITSVQLYGAASVSLKGEGSEPDFAGMSLKQFQDWQKEELKKQKED